MDEAAGAQPRSSWDGIRAATKRCDLCAGVMKACRLSLDEALWQCQAPGCLFPLSDPRFESFLIPLAGPRSPLSRRKTERTRGQTRGERGTTAESRSPPEPTRAEPFPLAGFDTGGGEGKPDELQPDVLPLDIEALLPDITTDKQSAETRPPATTEATEATGATGGTLSMEDLLFGDMEDCDDREAASGTDEASGCKSVNADHALSRCASMSPSASSADTIGMSTTTTHSHAESGAKRSITDVVEMDAELEAAWESSEEGENIQTSTPGDQTPLRPVKKRRNNIKCSDGSRTRQAKV